jgi:DNA-binding MarR family transcriptional regulator
MNGPNDVIHQAVRLKIMAALNVLAPDAALEFTRLKNIVGATDGNLGAHLDTLEKAGYVAIEKRFVGKKPQTRVRPTPSGRRAFAEHVAYLREIIDLGGAPA